LGDSALVAQLTAIFGGVFTCLYLTISKSVINVNSHPLEQPQVKKWRKSISNEEKLDVINRLAKGERIANIRRDVGLDKSNAQRTRDNADKTEEVLRQ